MDSNQEI